MRTDPHPPDEALLDRARALQCRIGVIDLHLDSVLQARLFGYRIARRHEAGMKGQPLFWHADLPRMREAGYGGALMGIHGWPNEREGRWRGALRQSAIVDRLCEAEEDVHRYRVGEPWPAHRPGQLVLAPAFEGAHLLARRDERVEAMARAGVAALTLAHFSRNRYAIPSMGRGASEEGRLSEAGRALVRNLNDFGIVVDVAHLNMPCVLDACRVSRAPLMATHSGARALHDHPRLLSNEAIDAIAGTGGVIGVIFAPGFLTPSLRSDSRCVVEHIEWIAERVGVRHVAIGTDLDGWLPAIPSDMRDCRDLVHVSAALLARGWSEDHLRLLLRDNALRVLAEVARARTRR